MAVYVKRNGLLGTAYVATIKPFRHLIVYPVDGARAGHDHAARPALDADPPRDHA
jgi:hypothetical protein